LAKRRPLVGMAVMQDRGRIVKDPPDAVPAKITYYRVTMALGITLDRVADRTNANAGLHDGDAAHHRFVSYVDQPPRLNRDTLADKKHAARIAVPAVEDHRYVDIEDVALHQPPLARDAVADDVVDRGTDRFREAAIVERRRDRIVTDDEAVAQGVEFVGGDPRTDMRGDEVERLGGEDAGLPHSLERLRSVDLDPAVARLGRREAHHHIPLHAEYVPHRRTKAEKALLRASR